MAAATLSGMTIRQLLVEQGDWVFLGAASGVGSASKITDAINLQGATIPSTKFDGCIVRIASGTRAGETSFVDTLDNSVGDLYLTPNLTGALAIADVYEIWMRGLDPIQVDRLRDDCLEKFCSVWRVNALSWLNDGDMNSSGVTNWTAAGGATRSKAFGSFPNAHSRRELVVVHTTASTDWVESDAVDVNPGERIFLQVPVKAYVTAAVASPATASVLVVDKTNTNATITIGGLKTTHIGRGPGWISILFTIPVGCYQFAIRLKSDTNASTTVWGGINCHKRQKSRWSYPDRITTKKRTGGIFTTSQINPAQSEQADFVFKRPDFTRIERVQVGSQVELYVDPTFSEIPYFFHERGYFDRLCTNYYTVAGRLAGDAATTDCVKEYIAAKLAAKVAKYQLAKYGADWQDDWVRCEADDNYWEGEMGTEPRLVHENEVPVPVIQFRI